jgi:hypothetical protein
MAAGSARVCVWALLLAFLNACRAQCVPASGTILTNTSGSVASNAYGTLYRANESCSWQICARYPSFTCAAREHSAPARAPAARARTRTGSHFRASTPRRRPML